MATSGSNHRAGPASSRIARNTLIRAAGEIVAKGASVAFFVVMARELDVSGFGAFIFGLSLSQLLLIIPGFGSQDLISREVARDHESVHRIFHNVLVMKGALLAVGWLAIWGVVALAGYPFEVQIAIAMIAAGVAVERQAGTYYAVFTAHERNELVATTLILQRGVTSIVGIAVLLNGGGLVAVCAVFMVGSLVGQLAAYLSLHRRLVSPERRIDRTQWIPLLRASIPLAWSRFSTSR